MEARIKKIFHRRRDDESEPSMAEDQSSEAGNTNSALPTSLYDLTIPREPPQTGTLPFQGNSTRLPPNHTSSISARGPSIPSPRSPKYGSVEVSTISCSDRDQQRLSGGMSQTGATKLLERGDDSQKNLPEIPFSPLSSSVAGDNEVCQFLLGGLDMVTNFGEAMTPMQANQSRAKSKVPGHDIRKLITICTDSTFRAVKRGG